MTAQITTLNPVRDFALEACLSGGGPPVTHSFIATSSGLHFLISPPFASVQYIVTTGFSGQCTQTRSLHDRVSPHSLTVEAAGRISVLKSRSAQKTEKLTIDSAGELASRVGLAERVFQLIPAGTEMIGVSTEGAVYVFSENGQVTRSFFPVSPQK